MSKVLYIKANVKPEGLSRTYKIADAFIEAYKEKNPEDEIITVDLYEEKIGFLEFADLGAVFGPKNEESRNHPILKYAYQFAEADKYVVAAPMWNLSIPAILKAYIDYISVTGITFKYTETGSVGLCKGNKALHIAARGGGYSKGQASEMEMGSRYLKALFAFMGIEDFNMITAETLDVEGQDIDGIVNEAIEKAKEVAKEF